MTPSGFLITLITGSNLSPAPLNSSSTDPHSDSVLPLPSEPVPPGCAFPGTTRRCYVPQPRSHPRPHSLSCHPCPPFPCVGHPHHLQNKPLADVPPGREEVLICFAGLGLLQLPRQLQNWGFKAIQKCDFGKGFTLCPQAEIRCGGDFPARLAGWLGDPIAPPGPDLEPRLPRCCREMFSRALVSERC